MMVAALELPEYIHVRNGSVFDAVEALGLTLARFRSAGDEFHLVQ